MNDDNDIPGIRLWGDSRLEKGETVVHPENDVKPSVGDDAIDLAILRSTPASRASARNEPQKTWLIVDLMTDDGAVLRDVAVNVATPSGTVNVRTDGAGRVELDVDDGTYDVSLPETPLAMPQPVKGAVRPGGGGLLVERTRTEPVHVSAWTPAKPTNVVVRRPCVLEVVIDGYAEGSSVMRWGGTRWRSAGPDAAPVLGTTRAALRMALTAGRASSKNSVVCVGHTDPKGSDVANAELGMERARSIALFLRGDKDGWAAHAAANATELDEQCALVEVSRILGSEVAFDDEDGLAHTHEDLLHWAGLDEPVDAKDEWRAIAELYEVDLASFMRIDVADLEVMRAAVQWYEPASCGEDYPREPADWLDPLLDKTVAAAVRQHRVGILVMTESDAPARLVDVPKEAYDGTYKRTTIETPSEVLFTLALVDEKGKPLPGARAWLSNDVGVSPVVADAGGLVIFPCARGEVVRVVNASDASKSGHVVAGGLSTTTTPSEGA